MPTVMKPNLPKGSLPEESRCFINGQFVQPSGPEWETINPATEEVICKIKEASTADVDKAVQAAHAAFPAWSTTDGRIRSKMMMTLADLIEEHTEQLAELESRDNGKPLSVASTVDLPLTVETIRYYAGWADKIVGEQVPIKSLDTSVKYLTICKREPIGVVAQVLLIISSRSCAPLNLNDHVQKLGRNRGSFRSALLAKYGPPFEQFVYIGCGRVSCR
eukprot:GHVT01101386.1.p1 GENE.GHVT01101386.1~~GHVT01101386.1.p1  ORF type:complete len:240 (+),score=12.88 GHVT01101386.1:66-722(+)